MTRHVDLRSWLVVIVASLTLGACETAFLKRGVTASVMGPSTLHVGEVAQLAVTLTFSDGESNPVPPSQSTYIRLQSSNTAVLSVSSSGEVRGIAPGTATVTVTPDATTVAYGSITPGTIAIAVVP
jgi:hypothetical protein